LNIQAAAVFKKTGYFILGALYFPFIFLLDSSITVKPYQGRILYLIIPGLLVALFWGRKKAFAFSTGLLAGPLSICILLAVYGSWAKQDYEKNLPILDESKIFSQLEDYKIAHGAYPTIWPKWLNSRYRSLKYQRIVNLTYQASHANGADFKICISEPDCFGEECFYTCYSSITGKWDK